MSIWRTVDELIDRAASPAALRAHGLQLLAARRWRTLGKPVDPEIVRDEELAAVRTLLVPVLLARIRDAYDSPVVVLKGPELAARYPDAALRPLIDVDLLVPEPELAQAALLEHGFAEADDPPWALERRRDRDPFADKHHTRPLMLQDMPLKIELHRWPSWPRWMTPPRPAELLASATPSSLGVEGVMTLPPAEHALVVAAHSWVHEPLGRLRDLLEVVLMAGEADSDELALLARRWGMWRLWSATLRAAQGALLPDSRPTLPLRTWARNVSAVRERTVLESHLENWVSCYWTTPPVEATRLALSNVAWDLRPAAGESWRAKLARAGRAAKNALSPRSAHEEEIGAEARRISPVTRWRKPPGPDA